MDERIFDQIKRLQGELIGTQNFIQALQAIRAHEQVGINAFLDQLQRDSTMTNALQQIGTLAAKQLASQEIVDGALANLNTLVGPQQSLAALAEGYASSLQASYHLPDLTETLSLNMAALDLLKQPTLSGFLPSQAELALNAGAIKNAWVDSIRPLQSFTGLTGLSVIGNALELSPYSTSVNGALHTLLGEWPQADLPKEMIVDWRSRLDFYSELGFDHRLTALPEPAFSDSLVTTGILAPKLYAPATPAPTFDEPKDAAVEGLEWRRDRMHEAYELITSLEIHLRIFLSNAMAERFGARWEVQRVPGPIVQTWKQKRQTALAKGETEHPLVWYADFTDYVQIITRRDNWRELFETVFSDQDDVKVSFSRLHPLRICTMHSRPLSKADFLLLTVEVHRLTKVIQAERNS